VTPDAPVRHALLGAGVVLAALLGSLGLVQWAGRERADFGPGALAAVERAVDAAGLQVCGTVDDPDGTVDDPDGTAATGAGGRAYEVAVSCPGDTATVVVDRFGSAAARDAAARRFESLVRPRGSGVVLTLADATVFLQGSGDGEAGRRLRAALRAEGAR
jgi:hypothetical protein